LSLVIMLKQNARQCQCMDQESGPYSLHQDQALKFKNCHVVSSGKIFFLCVCVCVHACRLAVMKYAGTSASGFTQD